MPKFIWDNQTQNWVPAHQYVSPARDRRVHIIRDDVEVDSPITGEVFTSKAKYYDHVKAHGRVIIGNEYEKYRHDPPKHEFRPAGSTAQVLAENLAKRGL